MIINVGAGKYACHIINCLLIIAKRPDVFKKLAETKKNIVSYFHAKQEKEKRQKKREREGKSRACVIPRDQPSNYLNTMISPFLAGSLMFSC